MAESVFSSFFPLSFLFLFLSFFMITSVITGLKLFNIVDTKI